MTKHTNTPSRSFPIGKVVLGSNLLAAMSGIVHLASNENEIPRKTRQVVETNRSSIEQILIGQELGKTPLLLLPEEKIHPLQMAVKIIPGREKESANTSRMEIGDEPDRLTAEQIQKIVDVTIEKEKATYVLAQSLIDQGIFENPHLTSCFLSAMEAKERQIRSEYISENGDPDENSPSLLHPLREIMNEYLCSILERETSEERASHSHDPEKILQLRKYVEYLIHLHMIEGGLVRRYQRRILNVS